MNPLAHLEETADRLTEQKALSHLAVRVIRNGEILGEVYRGADERTLFDMASVTKPVVTGTLALIAIDRGMIHTGDPVSAYFDLPQNKSDLTLLHLLTHTLGIGHKALNAPDINSRNVAERILSIPPDCPPGTEVRYSCPGYILLGKVLEKVWGAPLDRLFFELVAPKLGMRDSVFLPKERQNIVNANLSPEELGMVNDYNCRHLGGVAGNAGLFSDIADMTGYIGMLERRGAPLFREEIFEEAIANHTPGMEEWRGLGFLLVDPSYKQTGRLFPPASIGHCGHTGQSFFHDPRSGLSVLILSDGTRASRVKNGREVYAEVKALRETLHNAIADDLGIDR